MESAVPGKGRRTAGDPSRRTRAAKYPPLAAVLFLLLAPLVAVAAGLSEAEKRGKRIYLEGKGRRPVFAVLLSAGVKAPGAIFPCINCHLAAGTGQLEGGVQSPDVTWFTLTKEFTGRRPSAPLRWSQNGTIVASCGSSPSRRRRNSGTMSRRTSTPGNRPWRGTGM